MKAYHGTIVCGLKTLRPYNSPHSNYGEACVYLSTLYALAPLYIWNKPYKWLTYEFGRDGKPLYYETFPGSLRFFYQGVPGCIYSCEGAFEYVESVGIRAAVISREPVNVGDALPIGDAYTHITGLAAKGELDILWYDKLPPERHGMIRQMVLRSIHHLDLLKGEHPLSAFVPQFFPSLWEEALHEALRNKPDRA